jgi:hypothetical protein
MRIQRYRSHPVLLAVVDSRRTGGQRHRRIRAHSATGQVARAATEKPALMPIAQNGLPSLRSPESPRSQSAEATAAAGQQPSPPQFHAPTTASEVVRRRVVRASAGRPCRPRPEPSPPGDARAGNHVCSTTSRASLRVRAGTGGRQAMPALVRRGAAAR